MGRSPRQLQPLNFCATDAAGFSFAIVDPCHPAVVTVNALDIAKVAEGGAPGFDPLLEHLLNGSMEAL